MAKVKLKPPAKKAVATSKRKKGASPQHQRVLDFVSSFNRELRGKGKVVTGEEVAEMESYREPTGIPGLDYVLGGGLLRAHAAQFWGAYRSCKTSTCARIAANMQARGLSVALVCLEKFDKPWWRSHGVFIPYSEEEIKKIRIPVMRDKAQAYNDRNADKNPLTLVTHKSPIVGLDMSIKMVKANVFDLVIIDSLGVVSSDADEDSSIGDKSYGSAATPLKNFANKMTSALNTMYADGVASPVGDRSNDTMLVCINQARATIGSTAYAEDKKIHPTGGLSLQHLWSQEVFFQAKEEIGEREKMGERQFKKPTQHSFYMKGTKLRYGTQGRQVEVYMCIGPHQWKNGKTWPAGEFDVYESLRSVAENLGIVKVAAAMRQYDNQKFRGKDEFDVALSANPALYEKLYKDMLHTANLYDCFVPDVN